MTPTESIGEEGKSAEILSLGLGGIWSRVSVADTPEDRNE
jgi:hypothetical protein